MKPVTKSHQKVQAANEVGSIFRRSVAWSTFLPEEDEKNGCMRERQTVS